MGGPNEGKLVKTVSLIYERMKVEYWSESISENYFPLILYVFSLSITCI